MNSEKSKLLEEIRRTLVDRLARLSSAAQEAHAAATDPGSKAESKYDTRNLEASYLAVGQAKQVEELADFVRVFETLFLPDFQPTDGVDAGALVETRLNGEPAWFLLVPVAGGTEIDHEGKVITLLTPDSPLYRKLLEMRVGEELGMPPLQVTGVS